MSVFEEDRPKLKAKRFNKFEPSSSTPPKLLPEVENITKQGVKRNTGDNKNHLWEAKRICTNMNLNPSPVKTVKNLANNRLKKLKEQIQASVKAQDLSEQTNVPTKSTLKPNDFQNAGKYGKINKSYSETVVKNKYKNSFIGISPMNSSKKNLAEERLQNIKNKLNNTNASTKVSTKDRTSSVEINVKSNILKRNISSVTGIHDSDDMPSKKCLKKNANSPYCNVTEEQNNSILIKNKAKNPFPEMYNSSPVCCSTPIPQMPKIKKENYPVYADNLKKPEVTSSPFNATMCLFPNNENRNSIRHCKNDDTFNAFCQPTRKIDVTVDKGNTSTLPVDGSNNFLSKMQMTASWIRNHQVETSFNSFVEPQDNSFNETAKETLNETKFYDGSEEMEWTNAEPDDEVVDPNINTSETCNKDNKTVDEIIKDPEKMKDVCVIVDTNVFLSGLSKIQDIVNLKATGSFKPIVYVPWMVISELDYMKDSCSNTKLSKNILSAIKFINAALNNKNPRVIGQTVFDVEKQKHIGASPDDKIIACCLQVADKYETVILLSNDMNLKNKAMINDIPACSSNEIMIKLMSKLRKNTKTQKIMHKMGMMCSSVICDCMKSTYGDIWLKMDMMSCPPWSLGECLKRFKKYWSSVFSEKLMKQFTKTLQSLKELMDANKYFSDDSDEFIQFTKLCVTLCIFLKDIDECRGFVENTVADITKTAQ